MQEIFSCTSHKLSATTVRGTRKEMNASSALLVLGVLCFGVLPLRTEAQVSSIDTVAIRDHIDSLDSDYWEQVWAWAYGIYLVDDAGTLNRVASVPQEYLSA